MKSHYFKILPVYLLLCFTTTTQAQMSSPRAQYRSEASDSVYKETDEDAPKHLHQTVTIIDKKKLMPDGTYQTEKAYIHHRKDKAGKAMEDTTNQAEAASTANSAAIDTSMQVSESTPMKLIIPTDSDGGKPTSLYLLYGAIGLIGQALLLALFLLLAGRDKKRSPGLSALMAVCFTAGVSLLLAYSICLSSFTCALIALLCAAVSGGALLANDMNGRQNPMWLIMANIGLTIAGLGLAVYMAFSH